MFFYSMMNIKKLARSAAFSFLYCLPTALVDIFFLRD